MVTGRCDTHMLPASVEGGANRSGFWRAMGTFCGPMMVAPKPSRIACGLVVESSDQSTPFGSSLAYGTVSDAGRADDVPEARVLDEDAALEDTVLEDAVLADREDEE